MAIREDRATLGSDPSALMVACSMGRYLLVPPFYGFMLVPESDKSMQYNALTCQLFCS
jgi:hypothetical protein